MIKNLLKNSIATVGIFTMVFVFFASDTKAQNIDAGVTHFLSPIGVVHNGTNRNLQVRVRNFGNVAITSVKIGWTINGVPQTDVTQAINIPIPTNASQMPTGTITLSAAYADSLNRTVIAYVKEVNNFPGDNNAINDTLRATFGSPILASTKIIGKQPGDDYKSFTEAINAIRYNGLAGDVVFNIRPGSYDQDLIDLDASNIYFPNGTKKITFKSLSGLKDVLLISEPAVQTTVKLTGVDWFTISNVRIINRNIVSGIGINLLGGANYCTIRSCEITVDSISNAKSFAGIVAAVMSVPAYTLSGSTGGSAKYLTVKYNKISGGYYGIALYGPASPRDTLNQIDSNIIQQVSYYGIYVNTGSNLKMRGNKVTFRPSADFKSTGYFVSTVNTVAPQNIEISRNYVTDAGQYGMYLNAVTGLGTPFNRYVNITNNMITGGFTSNFSAAAFSATETPTGLFLNGVGWANIFFNSIYMDAVTKTGNVDNTAAFYVNGSPAIGNIYVYNNVFYNHNKGYGYYNASTTNPIIVSDNNDIFISKMDTNSSQATGFAYWGGAARTNLRDLFTASGKDRNTISKEPFFFSNSDLHTISPDLNGKGNSTALSQSPLDYDGEERDIVNPPDIGCDEFEPGGEDYAIIGITPDVFRYNQPTQWKITVRYQGAGNGVDSLYFKYRINGVEQLGEEEVIALYYDRLTGYFKSQTLSVPVNRYITRNDYRAFKLTVYFLPGSNANDLRASNDSLSVEVCVGLEGTFTIDRNAAPGPTTFTSFQEVYDYLKCGVSGPTIFEIADGTYDEQINLWKVRNSSEVNTITFKSKNNVFATKLTYANGTAENHSTVLFNNAQYIILRDLTIENRSAVNGTCIQLAGNSKFNVIRNNIIKVDSTLANYPNTLAPIVATKLGTLFTGQFASNASNNTIINNRIMGGFYGIAMFGTDTDKRDLGNIIEKNNITSFHKYGVYLEYSDTRVIQNIIVGKFGMDINAYGIYAKGLGDRNGVFSNEISKNRIFDITYQGIYLTNCLSQKNVGAKKSTFEVSNNMIGGGFTTFNVNTSGLFLNACLGISILHNTIYMDAPRNSTGSSSEQNPQFARCLIVNATNTNIEALNNILYSNNGALPLDYYTASGNTVPNGLVTCDYNLYYTSYNNKNTPLILIRRIRKTQQNTTTKSYGFSQLTETPVSALNKFKIDNGNTSRDRKSIAAPLRFEQLPYDFHTYDLNVESKAAGGQDILDDVDRDPRKSKTPDIGADEFTVPNYDLDINRVLNPLLSALKPNTIQVRLRNRGKYPLDNINVVLEYKVEDAENGFLYTNLDTVTLKMKKTGDEQVYKFKRRVSVPRRGYYEVCVRKVSGLELDTVYYNDKKCVNICTGIEGDYYVGFGSNYIPNTDTNRYYNTIQEALDKVECGIADDTYFNLNPGASPFAERVLIPKYLVNLDSPLLTIQPYGAVPNTAVQIVQPASPAGDNAKLHYTVRFNGSNFVKLKNLNIKHTGTNFGTAIHFTKKSNNNFVEDCKIEVSTSATTPYFYPIAFSSSNMLNLLETQSFANNGSYNTIRRNEIIGGYAGISMLGASVVDFDIENVVDSNDIKDFYKHGIYSINNTIKSISFNKLLPRVTALPTCVTISYNYAGEGGIINANKIIDTKEIAIKVFGVEAFPSKRLIISNNWITHSFGNSIQDTASAILIKGSNNIGIYYNSIRYNGFNAALNIAKQTITQINLETGNLETIDVYPGGIHVFNNIIKVDSVPGFPKKPYVIYYNSTDPASKFNNNAYHTGYDTRFAFYKTSADQKTFGVWQLNTAKDLKSLYEDPIFVDGYDLNLAPKPIGDTLRFDKKGVVVAGISRDFYNRKRSPRETDIGSIEYEKQEYDVSLLNIVNTKAVYGTNTFTVNILNDGNKDLSSKTICVEYSIDSGKTWVGRESVLLKDLKGRYDEQRLSFNLKYVKQDFFVIPLCVRIAPDCRLDNDTVYKYEMVCKELCVGLEKGEYTIGKNNNEVFNSIQQAVTALVCGFDSSIVFKVSPGVYKEQVSIPAIRTHSDTTVTFVSATGNPNDVILEYTPSTQNELAHHIIQLDGTRYITFKALTFKSNAQARSSGIHLADTANNITVDNCIFRFDSVSTVNTLVGVLASGKIAFTDPANVKNNTIRNSEFIGGAFGIRLLGVKDNAYSGPNKIINNKFRTVNTCAIDILYNQIDSIGHNEINMRKGNVESVGINIYGALTDFIISNNKVVNAQNNGLAIDSCRVISRGLIANNMFAGGFVSDNQKNEAGILIKGTGDFAEKGLYSNGFIDIVNNSVLYDGDGDTSSALFVLRSNRINMYNNIFANYGKGYAFQFKNDPSANATVFNDADANLVYTKGAVLAKWKDILCPKLSDLGVQDAGNSPFNETRSVSIDPLFKSNYDLHINNYLLDGSGTYRELVLTDFDGQVRDKLTPDIGCDEFFPSFDLQMDTFITPLEGSAFQNENQVIVRIKNKGADVYSVKARYLFDGVFIDSVVKNYIEPLMLDSTDILVFNKKFSTRQAGPHKITAFTEIRKIDPVTGKSVNNDFSNLNDTLTITVISKDTSDIGVANYLNPRNGWVLSKPEPVQVQVTNYGNLTASNFKIQLKVNNKIKETLNITEPLLGKETKEYQFNYSVDPDSAVYFEVCATTILFDDVIEANDSNCIVLLTVGVIESSAGKELFNVHPNPTSGKLNFGIEIDSDKKIDISVFDLSGRLIKTDELGVVSAGKQNLSIYYDDLSEGTYFFVMNIGNKKYNGRFVVIK